MTVQNVAKDKSIGCHILRKHNKIVSYIGYSLLISVVQQYQLLPGKDQSQNCQMISVDLQLASVPEEHCKVETQFEELPHNL